MSYLADLSIRAKFLLLPALAAVLMLLLGIVYISGQREEMALQERINQRDVPRMRELSRLFSEFSTNHSQFINLLASSLRDGAQAGRFYADGRARIVAVNRTLAELQGLSDRLPDAARPHDDAEPLRQRLIRYRDRMGETVLMSSVDRDLIAQFTLEANESYDAANTEFLGLIDRVQEAVVLESRQLQGSLRAAQTRFFMVLAGTLVLIAAASLLLSRHFATDLTALMAMLRRLADGKTEAPPMRRRGDEFGAVYNAVQAFHQTLRERDLAEQRLVDEANQRARMSERLQQAVRASQTGIFEYDLMADQTVVSDNTRVIFGLDPVAPVAMSQYFAAIHPADRTRVKDALRAANDPRGDGSLHIDHRIVQPDGEQRWLALRSQTFFAGEGAARHPVYSVGAVRDISEQLRIEFDLRTLNEDLEQRVASRTEELNAAKDEAERANRAKSEFLSRMSHELRTPLNAILGFGQLIQMKADQPAPPGHVSEILRAGRHLLELVDEVLDLARVESGMLTISPEPVALLPLVQDCLALLRPQALTQGIRLLDASAHCDLHVRTDRTRLKQVLLNLLSNAVKYNRPHGSVSVVCVAALDASPPSLTLRVCDTGAGLTPGQQARLFVPFERLDAEERRIQGTGIGLALSKRLIELMQGEIGVESTPGAGSTFWVRLPLAQAHAEPSPPAAPAEGAAAPRPLTARRDVLCIEDNPANLRLIESIFAHRPDLRLLSAIAPGLGLELARTHRPALILLDINLPDMDGYAVLQCLRENPITRDIPVIATSANAMPRDVERGRAAGFAEYLTKPLAIDRLMRVVDQLVAPEPR